TWVHLDCPRWTCRAPLHRGRRSASRLRLSLPAPLQPVPVTLQFLPAALQSLAALVPSLRAPVQSVDALVPSLRRRDGLLRALLPSFSAAPPYRRSVRFWVCRPPARRHSSVIVQIISVGSWLLLSAFAVAKVGDPFLYLGVVRNESAVRLVMLERAWVIPEI